jgi:hypothetical protein
LLLDQGLGQPGGWGRATNRQTMLPTVAADIGISLTPPEIHTIVWMTMEIRFADAGLPPMRPIEMRGMARASNEVTERSLEVLLGPK